MPKNKKLFIFDLDGTLIHFHKDYIFAIAEEVITDLGHPKVSRIKLEENFSSFDFLSSVSSDHQVEFDKRFWEKFDWQSYSNNQPIAGVKETLEKLFNSNRQIAIATSRYCCPNDLKKDLGKINFSEFIHLITTKSDPLSSFKDKVKQLDQIFSHFKTDPIEAVMIGDIPPDISCAKEYGIGTTIAVLSGGIKREILEKEKPNYILQDVGSLLKLIS